MGRRNTRIDQEREDGGYESRSSARGDGCYMYIGFVNARKKWLSKEPLMGLAHFILTHAGTLDKC